MKWVSGYGYVYAIGIVGRGEIKIGVCSDIKRRLSELQRWTPCDLFLIHKRRCRGYHQALIAERNAHAALKEHRGRGEWFNVTAEAAISAITSAKTSHIEKFRALV